jgi:hypothetical protein
LQSIWGTHTHTHTYTHTHNTNKTYKYTLLIYTHTHTQREREREGEARERGEREKRHRVWEDLSQAPGALPMSLHFAPSILQSPEVTCPYTAKLGSRKVHKKHNQFKCDMPCTATNEMEDAHTA